MAINFPGGLDDLENVTTSPDTVPLSQADIAGGTAPRNHDQHHRDMGAAVVAIQNILANWQHDHSGDTPDTDKPGLRKGSRLKQAHTHEEADTDISPSSIHHTLGYGNYQAAPGPDVDNRLNNLSSLMNTLSKNVDYRTFRVFDTYNEMNSFRTSASEDQLSESKPVIAYAKNRDALFLLVSKTTAPQTIITGTPVGAIFMFAGSDAPFGALRCDGSSHLKSSYPVLYDTIGGAYGESGNYFNVPDLTGRVPVGRDPEDTDMAARGRKGGSKTHAHNEGDMTATIGTMSGDRNTIGYRPVKVHPRAPKTTGNYTLKATALSQVSREFSHNTPVFGTTSQASSMPPFTVVDYYIRAM